VEKNIGHLWQPKIYIPLKYKERRYNVEYGFSNDSIVKLLADNRYLYFYNKKKNNVGKSKTTNFSQIS